MHSKVTFLPPGYRHIGITVKNAGVIFSFHWVCIAFCNFDKDGRDMETNSRWTRNFIISGNPPYTAHGKNAEVIERLPNGMTISKGLKI